MWKKIGVLALCVCMALSMFAGIGGAGAEPEKVTIDYYTFAQDEDTNPVIEAFMKDYPHIEVRVNIVPDNSERMTNQDIVALGGGAIDIMTMTGTSHWERAENGMLAPLDEFIEKQGVDMAANFGTYKDWVQMDGKYYAYPLRVPVNAVFYNKDLFDAAGIPYPADDWTVADYLAIAEKLTSGEGPDKVYGAYTETWDCWWAFFAVQKASWYKEDGTSNADDPLFRDALQMRFDLDSRGIQKSYTEIRSSKTSNAMEFVNGRAAMVPIGAYMVRTVKMADPPVTFKTGCVAMPRLDETVPPNTTTGNVATLGVLSTSKHKEEAFTFIRYYIEQGALEIANRGQIPAYIPAYGDEMKALFISGSGLAVEDVSPLFDPNLTMISHMPVGTAGVEYNKIIVEESSLYFSGEKSLDDTVSAIKTRADAAIAEALAEKAN